MQATQRWRTAIPADCIMSLFKEIIEILTAKTIAVCYPAAFFGTRGRHGEVSFAEVARALSFSSKSCSKFSPTLHRRCQRQHGDVANAPAARR
jgi:hypothetical protein